MYPIMRQIRLNKNKVSVVGLGKLGLPFAACLAKRGFEVIGVDINKQRVNSINNSISPIIETGLQELLKKVQGKLTATGEHKRAVEETDITFLVVATPSDRKGNFSNKYVESALKSLSDVLRKSNKKYHLFIINSTLMPGSTEQRLIPLIEKYSRRKLNVGFGMCYIPDFVAIGSVVRDFLNPEFIIIGESDKFAGDQAVSIYKRFCENKPVIHRMSIIGAEIAKMSVNAYITLKISFANALGNLCEKIADTDIDLITKVLGSDRRISPYYLKAGLSFGGTCFPRDTKAFIAFSKKLGYNAELIRATEKINSFQDQHLAELVFKCLSEIKDNRVSILGLAFKPNTPLIEASPAIKLIKNLLKQGIKITVYDPLAIDNTKAVFGNKIKYASSLKNCLGESNIWVITTPDEEFKRINKSYINHFSGVIIDCWRILKPEKLGKKTIYIPLGKNLC